MRPLVAAALALLCLVAGATTDAEFVELRTAQFSLSSQRLSSYSELATLPAQRVQLPDSWPLRGAARQGYGWYRLQLPEFPPSLPVWIYVPRAVSNADMYFNGELLWSGGAMEPRPSRSWSRPALFPLPRPLFKDGANELAILVGVDGSQPGMLSSVYAGAFAPLNQWARQRSLLQREGIFVTSGIILATGLYLLLLWVRTRHERTYLYLGLAGVVWSLRNVEVLVVEGHTPAWLIESLDLLAISGHGVFFGLFGLFMLELVKTPLDRHTQKIAAAIWVCILGSAVGVLSSRWLPFSAYAVLSGWLLVCFPIVAYLVARLSYQALRRHDQPLLLAAMVAVTFFVASVYDNLVATHRLPPHWIYIAHYAGLFFFLCFAGLTIGRFSRLLRDYQALNLNLEHRVADNEKKIAQQYEELIASERRRSMLEERDRIMRDLHDGLGSQLVGAIHEVRAAPVAPGELEGVLARCLDELRLAIESLDPDTRHLPTMLGALRYRMERRLHAANIELTWDVQDVPKLAELESSRLLNVMRLLQEAFTNTLKHADATTIAVHLREVADAVELRYEDNGRGIDAAATPGYGIENMRRRARAADLRFDMQSNTAGTLISLRLPVVT